MKPIQILAPLFLALFPGSTFAADIDSVFRASFFDSRIYTENRCGENIERFVLRLKQSGLSIAGIEVIEIVNNGIENLGLVGAQKARIGYPMNWGHHVIAYDGRNIYDFDFGGAPDLKPPAAYFDEMFKTPKMRASQERCLKEIGSYELRVYTGQNYLDYQARRARGTPKLAKLRDLPQWACGNYRQAMRRVGR